MSFSEVCCTYRVTNSNIRRWRSYAVQLPCAGDPIFLWNVLLKNAAKSQGSPFGVFCRTNFYHHHDSGWIVGNRCSNRKIAPLLLQLTAPLSQFKHIPYDLNCHSVKPHLSSRIFRVCSLCHASQKDAKLYLVKLHKDACTPP